MGQNDPIQQYAQALVKGMVPVGNALGNAASWGLNAIQQGAQQLLNPKQVTPQVMQNAKQLLTPTPTQTWYTEDQAYGRTPNATSTPTPQQQVQSASTQQNPTPTTYPGVDDNVAQSMTSMLQDHIFPITRKFGIPDSITASQMAQESTFGQKPAANNNFFGLKAHSYPGFAHFDTPEQAATYYAQTVRALVPNLDQIKGNPMQVLQALQSGKQTYEADNPNPLQYVYDVSNNPVWKAYGNQPMKNNPNGWKQ